jgi:hypothetical protein
MAYYFIIHSGKTVNNLERLNVSGYNLPTLISRNSLNQVHAIRLAVT